jgi:hypothetical protein
MGPRWIDTAPYGELELKTPTGIRDLKAHLGVGMQPVKSGQPIVLAVKNRGDEQASNLVVEPCDPVP